MKFSELDLVPELVKALEDLKIDTCTDIQEKAIPHVLEGRDISGLSQTGTGKTFAFLVPMIDRIVRTKKGEEGLTEAELEVYKLRAFDEWKAGHFILVLAPTRELVDQIYNGVKAIGEACGITTVSVYGGVDYKKQKSALNEGVDIVVGTPGRLLDLYKSHVLNLRHIRGLVFDEADRMFDMGFKDDMVYILQRCPNDRQILLFSATLNFDVNNTIYRFGSNPVELNVSRDQVEAANVTDEIFHVGHKDKPQYLLSLLKRHNPKQTIIFSNFKSNVDRITKFLNLNGQPAVGISSLLTQSQRDRVLKQFKGEGEKNILVATDVAARGLDIREVDLVINFELPDDSENYVHRIGRTGRAGDKGFAYSLVSDRDVEALYRIESYVDHKLEIGWVDDADLLTGFEDFPREQFKDKSRIRKTGLAAAKTGSGSRDNKSRDSKNRNSRGRDNKDSGSNRSQRSPNRNAHRAASADKTEKNVHRDRSSGRHRTANKNLNGNVKQSAATDKAARTTKTTKRRSVPKGRNIKRRSSSQTSSNVQSQSLGKKISGFFKKLID